MPRPSHRRCPASPVASARPGAIRMDGSDEFQLGDLIIAITGRGRYFDIFTDLPPDQRTSERRRIGNAPDLGIGLGLADDLVFDGFVVLIEQDRKSTRLNSSH